MSFLKFIHRADKTVSELWERSPQSAFKNATLEQKCFFVLDQSIMLSYMDYLYGKEHTKLVNEYRKNFINWYLSDLKFEFDNNQSFIVKVSYLSAASLLGIIPSKINADECIMILNRNYENVPCACDESFYSPYLKFKEKVSDLTVYTENEQMNKSRSFKLNRTVTIPSLKIIGHYLITRFETEFTFYEFSYNRLKDLLAENIEINSIFTFMAGYNWKSKNITSVMGVLAAQCLTLDINAMPKSSLMRGYLEIYNKVVPQVSVIGFKSNSLALSSDTTTQRRKILQFLVYIRKHYNTLFDDMGVIANYAANTETEYDLKLKSYLLEPDPANISSESYDAFKQSRFAGFEEFELAMKLERLKKSKGYQNAKKKDDDSPNTQEPQTEEGTPNEGSSNKKKPTEDAAPDSGEEDTANDLTDLESPSGIQDSSNGETSNSNDQNAGTNINDTEQNPDQNTNSNNNEESQNQSPEDKLPPVPKVSDKRGVKLKLSEGESPDTVLYREEIKAYIDSLLANPPSYLSVQIIAGIKCLKANWLYLLDVQHLHDFLAAMIKLPKTLNKIKK